MPKNNRQNKKPLQKNYIKKGEYYSKKFYGLIKNNIGIISLIVSSITLYYVVISHKSPPDFHCELYMIQRPDSVYQANIDIWNTGDEPAENITFIANKNNIFLADTSKKKPMKLPLLVYPVLSVYSTLTPSKILNHLGREVSFNNYKFNIPKLPTSHKNENYFVICINSRDQKKFLNRENSIYDSKFRQLRDIPGYKNYIEEIYSNIQIFYAGKIYKPELSGIYKIQNFDTSKYFFPTLKDITEYPKKATAPDYLLPPLKVLKVLKDKNENDGHGFKGYKKFKGFKGW